MESAASTAEIGPVGATPWLSVVMPIYNGAATLGATLASLKGQTDDIEILAVDQGSTDGSRTLLEDAKSHVPLRIIDNPGGTGWTANTNLGFNLARAPLVTMLHQDDIWHANRTRVLAAMAKAAPDVDLWLHAGALIDEAGRRIGRMAPPFGRRARTVTPSEALPTLFVQNTVALPAAMMRLEKVLATGGLDEKLWYTADWDLWLRLAERGLGWDPAEAAAFRIHDRSLTVTGSNDSERLRAQFAATTDRHRSLLPPETSARTDRLAAASIRVNLALAAGLNGDARPLAGALGTVLALGPALWPAFLSRSQIFQRLLPRLRLAIRGRLRGPRLASPVIKTEQ